MTWSYVDRVTPCTAGVIAIEKNIYGEADHFTDCRHGSERGESYTAAKYAGIVFELLARAQVGVAHSRVPALVILPVKTSIAAWQLVRKHYCCARVKCAAGSRSMQ